MELVANGLLVLLAEGIGEFQGAKYCSPGLKHLNMTEREREYILLLSYAKVVEKNCKIQKVNLSNNQISPTIGHP